MAMSGHSPTPEEAECPAHRAIPDAGLLGCTGRSRKADDTRGRLRGQMTLSDQTVGRASRTRRLGRTERPWPYAPFSGLVSSQGEGWTGCGSAPLSTSHVWVLPQAPLT